MTPERTVELLSQSEAGRAQLRVAAEFARTFDPSKWRASTLRKKSKDHPRGAPCWRNGDQIIHELPAGYSTNRDGRVVRTEEMTHVDHGAESGWGLESSQRDAKEHDESTNYFALARNAAAGRRLSPRKMRLVLATLGRQLSPLLTEPHQAALRQAHLIAEGHELPGWDTYDRAIRSADALVLRPGDQFAAVAAARVASQSISPHLDPSATAGLTYGLEQASHALASKYVTDSIYHEEGPIQAAHRHLANVVRSFTGNPYRRERIPVSRDIRALAQAVHDDNDPSTVGPLSDALEEAGASPYTLNALRNNHGVARGHWVVDAILGKR